MWRMNRGQANKQEPGMGVTGSLPASRNEPAQASRLSVIFAPNPAEIGQVAGGT
jgi:hypothetical protein